MHSIKGARLAAGIAAVLLTGLLTACGSAAPVHPAPVPDPPAAGTEQSGSLEAGDVNAWLDGMVPAALRQSDIAGATVAVVHDGEVLTTRGYGHADTGADGGTPEPVDPEETLFQVGSVAKVVTATAVMQLLEAGDLDLDTDVGEYLDFELPLRFAEPVTLRHLLTHTAGFEDRYHGMANRGEVDLRTNLVTEPPEQVYRPGTTPAYSNYGLGLAGYIVEHLSGIPFQEYVEEHITGPLGMMSSTFAHPLSEPLQERLARPYPDIYSPAAEPIGMNPAPAGALTSSAADMARFMLAHLGDGEPVLAEETREQMFDDGLGPDSLGSLTESNQVGLGFWQLDRNGHQIVGHGGDWPPFHSHLQIYPEHGTGIFISVNSSGADPADSLVLRESVLHGFTDRYFPAAGQQQPGVDEQTTAEHARIVAGDYQNARIPDSTFMSMVGLTTRIHLSAMDDGRLVADPVGAEPMILEEIRPWVWREVGGHQTLTAQVVGGQVEVLGYDPATSFRPVEPMRSGAVLPVLIASVAVLLVSLLAWPVGALLQRLYGVARSPAGSRALRVMVRSVTLATLVSLAGWASAFLAVQGWSEPPAAVLRVLQVLLALGLLGVVPATWRVVQAARERVRWPRVVAAGLIPLALVGVGWFALAFNLIAPSISY